MLSFVRQSTAAHLARPAALLVRCSSSDRVITLQSKNEPAGNTMQESLSVPSTSTDTRIHDHFIHDEKQRANAGALQRQPDAGHRQLKTTRAATQRSAELSPLNSAGANARQRRHDPGIAQRKAARLAKYNTSSPGFSPPARSTSTADSQPLRDTGLEHQKAASLSKESVESIRPASGHSTPQPRHDPGMEQRKAARHAKEALLQRQAETIGNRRSRSSVTASRTGRTRSQVETSKPGAAEAIMAISQHEAEARTEAMKFQQNVGAANGAHKPNGSEIPFRLTRLTGPEPIPSNLEAIFNATPLLLRRSQKLQEASVERGYSGDYSKYQSGVQDYARGALGPQATYAKIILERNCSIPLDSQQHLLSVIQRVTHADKPIVTKT